MVKSLNRVDRSCIATSSTSSVEKIQDVSSAIFSAFNFSATFYFFLNGVDLAEEALPFDVFAFLAGPFPLPRLQLCSSLVLSQDVLNSYEEISS